MSYSPFNFLNFNLGKGNNFWGDGYRSLFLSDNSAAYPYLKTSLNIWKIKYLFLISTLADQDPMFGDNGLSLKLQFSHFLSYNVNSWLNLGLFESIISSPKDSLGVTYLNPAYLNPVIFLRPVEFASGSADNAVLGLSLKIKLFKKYQIYTQFLVDEFVLSEMKSNEGWWGNKFGVQTGIKIFDLLEIENLFFRLEYNQVRPYTYSHNSSFLNYGNHYQAIAHPMGANFREFIFESHYHYKRYSLQLLAFIGEAGMDIDTISYGQDIYKPNVNRSSDYGISQGQGMKKRYRDIKLKLGWLFNYKMDLNVFISAQFQNYFKNPVDYKATYFSIGISSLLFNDELDYFR
jgi:hypothetical protein